MLRRVTQEALDAYEGCLEDRGRNEGMSFTFGLASFAADAGVGANSTGNSTDAGR